MTPDHPEVVVTVRLPHADHVKLKSIAAANHRSINGELRKVIGEYLDGLPVEDVAA